MNVGGQRQGGVQRDVPLDQAMPAMLVFILPSASTASSRRPVFCFFPPFKPRSERSLDPFFQLNANEPQGSYASVGLSGQHDARRWDPMPRGGRRGVDGRDG